MQATRRKWSISMKEMVNPSCASAMLQLHAFNTYSLAPTSVGLLTLHIMLMRLSGVRGQGIAFSTVWLSKVHHFNIISQISYKSASKGSKPIYVTTWVGFARPSVTFYLCALEFSRCLVTGRPFQHTRPDVQGLTT